MRTRSAPDATGPRLHGMIRTVTSDVGVARLRIVHPLDGGDRSFDDQVRLSLHM